MTANASRKVPNLSKARRAQLANQLESALLLAAQCATALLADDLRRIDQDDQDQGTRVKDLSLISHRAQLALGIAQGLHR
jgi:hypothetical protein